MKQLKIVNGFPDMPDGELLARALGIRDGLSGNPTVFPDPSPSLTVLNAQITAFQTAMVNAAGGSEHQKAVRDQARNELIDTLHSLGNYVLFIANGNLAVALLSGYRVAKTPEPKGPVTAPEVSGVRHGLAAGELTVRFRRVPSATGYMFEITPSPVTPESVWEMTPNTVCRHTFTGLERGREYCIRVAAIGINSQVVYSGIVTQLAL